MPQPLSIDLRERVVAAYEAADTTVEDLARRFRIAPSTVYDWVNLKEATGSVAPREARRGPPSTVTQAQLVILKRIIDRRPDLTYEELTERWNQALGTHRHRSTTVRAVKALGYTLKKNRS